MEQDHQDIQSLRSNVQHGLQRRQSRERLIQLGILKDENVQDSKHETITRLEHTLSHRASIVDLQNRSIIGDTSVAPVIAQKKQELEKLHRKERLNEFLEERPGILDLVQREIVPERELFDLVDCEMPDSPDTLPRIATAPPAPPFPSIAPSEPISSPNQNNFRDSTVPVTYRYPGTNETFTINAHHQHEQFPQNFQSSQVVKPSIQRPQSNHQPLQLEPTTSIDSWVSTGQTPVIEMKLQPGVYMNGQSSNPIVEEQLRQQATLAARQRTSPVSDEIMQPVLKQVASIARVKHEVTEELTAVQRIATLPQRDVRARIKKYKETLSHTPLSDLSLSPRSCTPPTPQPFSPDVARSRSRSSTWGGKARSNSRNRTKKFKYHEYDPKSINKAKRPSSRKRTSSRGSVTPSASSPPSKTQSTYQNVLQQQQHYLRLQQMYRQQHTDHIHQTSETLPQPSFSGSHSSQQLESSGHAQPQQSASANITVSHQGHNSYPQQQYQVQQQQQPQASGHLPHQDSSVLQSQARQQIPVTPPSQQYPSPAFAQAHRERTNTYPWSHSTPQPSQSQMVDSSIPPLTSLSKIQGKDHEPWLPSPAWEQKRHINQTSAHYNYPQQQQHHEQQHHRHQQIPHEHVQQQPPTHHHNYAQSSQQSYIQSHQESPQGNHQSFVPSNTHDQQYQNTQQVYVTYSQQSDHPLTTSVTSSSFGDAHFSSTGRHYSLPHDFSVSRLSKTDLPNVDELDLDLDLFPSTHRGHKRAQSWSGRPHVYQDEHLFELGPHTQETPTFDFHSSSESSIDVPSRHSASSPDFLSTVPHNWPQADHGNDTFNLEMDILDDKDFGDDELFNSLQSMPADLWAS